MGGAQGHFDIRDVLYGGKTVSGFAVLRWMPAQKKNGTAQEKMANILQMFQVSTAIITFYQPLFNLIFVTVVCETQSHMQMVHRRDSCPLVTATWRCSGASCQLRRRCPSAACLCRRRRRQHKYLSVGCLTERPIVFHLRRRTARSSAQSARCSPWSKQQMRWQRR